MTDNTHSPSMAPASPPIIAITQGDPAGVGPELCLRLLANEEIAQLCTPVVFGDAGVLQRVASATGLEFTAPVIESLIGNVATPSVLHLPQAGLNELQPGITNAATGAASYAYIEAALLAARRKQVAAIATGPINKEAWHAAGIHFPGHTELFATRTAAAKWCMLQYSPEITCSFVTVHVGYAEVPKLITAERVYDVIELTRNALLRLRGHEPQLVVCGLNPHAGEHGLFGEREEERFLVPAIARANSNGWRVTGPLPPDTCFLPERRATTDAFVCMYHDQGHIPLKALAFDSAVNTTLGLPLVRTSVDHGTACDIAWQGTARPHSLFAAVRLAVRLAAT